MIKNPPEMQETWVQPLGGEDPLEKEMVTHSSILAWKIICTEEPGGSLFFICCIYRSPYVNHKLSLPHPLPFDNHKFVSYFCEPTSVLEISLFILFLLDVGCDTIVVFV